MTLGFVLWVLVGCGNFPESRYFQVADAQRLIESVCGKKPLDRFFRWCSTQRWSDLFWFTMSYQQFVELPALPTLLDLSDQLWWRDIRLESLPIIDISMIFGHISLSLCLYLSDSKQFSLNFLHIECKNWIIISKHSVPVADDYRNGSSVHIMIMMLTIKMMSSCFTSGCLIDIPTIIPSPGASCVATPDDRVSNRQLPCHRWRHRTKTWQMGWWRLVVPKSPWESWDLYELTYNFSNPWWTTVMIIMIHKND